MRKFLAVCLCVLCACTLVFANGTQETSGVVKLDVGTVYANEHIFALAMDQMMKELNTAAPQFKMTNYHNSTLGSEKELVDAIAAGTVQMAIVGGGQIGAMYAPLMVFDAPYCIDGNEQLQKVSDSGVGKKLFDDLATQKNIRVLGALYAGRRFITTSNKAVYQPTDLKGLKIRVPDQELSIANFKQFGASPTPMAFSEVYLALQQGVVDGQENPLTQIMSAKFYEVQKYISLTGHVTQCVFLVCNENFYQRLSDTDRKILSDMARKYCQEASVVSVNFENETVEKLQSDYGMTVCEPNIDAFKALAKSVVTNYESRWGAGLYEQIQAIH